MERFGGDYTPSSSKAKLFSIYLYLQGQKEKKTSATCKRERRAQITMSHPKHLLEPCTLFKLSSINHSSKPQTQISSLIHPLQRSWHRCRLSSGRRGSLRSSKVVNAVARIDSASTALPQFRAGISKLPAAVHAGNAYARHIRDDTRIDLVDADLASRASLGVNDEATAGFARRGSRQSWFGRGSRGG